MTRRAAWALVLVAVLAATLRVVHQGAVAARDPQARVPMGDERTFLEWAHRVAKGQDAEAPYQSPLYPTLLGTIERAHLDPLPAARWLQALLGLVTAGLAARVAWEASRDRRVAVVAFALCALARPLIHAEGTLLREPASAAVLAAAALAYLRARERGRIEDHIALGLALGLGAVLRENFAVVALVVVVERALAAARAARRRDSLLALAVLLVAIALPVLPFDAKVARLDGGVHLLPNWNQGCVFYLANRRDNPTDAGYSAPPFVKAASADAEIAGFRAEAERRVGRALTGHEVSRFWLGEGLREVAAAPGLFAKRVALRALASLAPSEAAHQRDIEVDAERSRVLRAPLVDMGVLVALALVAALGALPRPRAGTGALLLLAAAWWLSLVVAAFTTRYRVPATPLLAALGALGARDLAAFARRRDLARLAFALALVAGIFALRFFRAPADHANAWLTRGKAGFVARDYASATEDLVRVAAARPDDVDVHLLLGEAARRVEPPRVAALVVAREAFARVVALDATRRAGWHGLAVCELALRRPHAALAAAAHLDARVPEVATLVARARERAARGQDVPLPLPRR